MNTDNLDSSLNPGYITYQQSNLWATQWGLSLWDLFLQSVEGIIRIINNGNDGNMYLTAL